MRNTLALALLLAAAPAHAMQSVIIAVGPLAKLEQLPILLRFFGARNVERLPLFGMVVFDTNVARLTKLLKDIAPRFPGFQIAPDVSVTIDGEDDDALGTEEWDPEPPGGVRSVGAPGVWPVATGKGVKVAVVDSGIDFTPPDLAPNYAGGVNIIDPSSPPLDDFGHGTHVAGTIAAARNHEGVAGVAPEASLFAVKVLDGKGDGGLIGLVKGLHWCAEHRMDVANLSMSFGKESLGPSEIILRLAVDQTVRHGTAVIAAAGNEHGGKVEKPAAYASAIAVSASDSRLGLASFSNLGPQIDFIAPGSGVLSTYPGGGYMRMNGTSMATPHVSGLAALAVQLGASSPAEIRAKLEEAAEPLPGLTTDQQGRGFIHADRWLPELALAD